MAEDTLKWSFGLLNSANKYLTAEQFQDKVTCNGTTMKKKQIWVRENVSGESFALKSYKGKYLTSDKNGKVDCSGEEIGPDQTFVVETQEDGKIAIKSATHNRYIGGSGDNMTGFDQSVGPTNLFVIHLAIHPQVNIRNVNRKTYIHYNEEAQELQCKEEIPWGYDPVIILEFYEGKYALRACNTQYLSRTGQLCEEVSNDTLFVMVFKGAQVAFKDCVGKYLTAVGASATVQSRKSSIGKDELFELMDSRPQIKLTASNGKLVSVRDSNSKEVRANQSEVTDKEIFQMEPVDLTDMSGNVKWCIRSCYKTLWNSGATVIANAEDSRAEVTHFSIEWMGPMVAIKGSNGKYVSIKANGQMAANSSEVTDSCKFVFEFINRPILVLRGEFGFVGVKGASGTLECNRSAYDVFGVSGSAGTYHIQGANKKYFKVESDNTMSINGDKPTDFFFELRANSRMIIVAPNGKFLKGQQSGMFSATGDSIASNTLWEY